MADIVFEGDEFTRGNTRGGAVTEVAKSSVAEYLLRRRFVRSERQARWVAAGIAALSVGLVAASVSWATKTLGATPDGKPFSEMTREERAALPVRHRLYMEKLERAAAEEKERELLERGRRRSNEQTR
jgi:hypothetical protein